MTDEEINFIIEEFISSNDRWFIIKNGFYYRPDAHGYTTNESEAWVLPKEIALKHQYLHGTPDQHVTIRQAKPRKFASDLNEMHEAEKHLGALGIEYAENLAQIIRPGYWAEVSYEAFPHYHATAKQKAMAFVKTIKENKPNDR